MPHSDDSKSTTFQPVHLCDMGSSILTGLANSRGKFTSPDQIFGSQGFAECNCYFLKNLSTGQLLLMHVKHERRDKRTRGLPEDITEEQARHLEEFLSHPGKKVGINLFRPSNRDIAFGVGGTFDGGITHYLKDQGVNIKRLNLYSAAKIDCSLNDKINGNIFFNFMYVPKTGKAYITIETDFDNLRCFDDRDAYARGEIPEGALSFKPFERLNLFGGGNQRLKS